MSRSYRFTHALCRRPGASVASGLRAGGGADPQVEAFRREHDGYVSALAAAGVAVTVLPALEAFPDSVFVEDAALMLSGLAVALRPGAPSRFGEAAEICPALAAAAGRVVDLANGFVDGGDVLLGDDVAWIGLSARTDAAGVAALRPILADQGYRVAIVETPPEILHFKTDCGLLDAETIFATRRLAAAGCFADRRVIEAPEGEEAAANLIRVNDVVLVRTGFPRTVDRLESAGYRVRTVTTDEAAKVDGGLSCMSLRFAIG